MSSSPPGAPGRHVILLAGLLTAAVVRLAGQSPTIGFVDDALYVKAPAFGFIEGQVLDRLHDGRSVRLDFDLAVLTQPGGSPMAQVRQTFTLSFDLWEERFAVSRTGSPPHAISHLTARGAEIWCLEHVTLPRGELSRLGDAPFWIRIGYHVLAVASTSSDADAPFTLGRLIDALSRRRQDGELRKTLDAGPFRVPAASRVEGDRPRAAEGFPPGRAEGH